MPVPAEVRPVNAQEVALLDAAYPSARAATSSASASS
jgi:hypothetical protein